jgi:hypothetical protein
MQQSYANNFSAEASQKELKKIDIYDLGIMLCHASLGGLDLINEEFLAKVPGIQTTCCIIHAIKNHLTRQDKPDKQLLTLMKVFSRFSEHYQDFICCCM